MKTNRETGALVGVIAIAFILFGLLYRENQIKIESVVQEEKGSTTLSEWTVEESELNGVPLVEDKSIYEFDAGIHDVYINVFPTEDSAGNMLNFDSFDLHQSRDHSYNPVLDCNIQILEAGQTLDPIIPTNVKNATIRVRGNSSRGDTYKSYKVKLEEDAKTFHGLSTFNINKHSEDVMKVSTKMCTDLLVDIPDITSFRTYFFRVWICDASEPADQQKYRYYGLYTDIEQPNKSYLTTRNLSDDAVMYKASNFSFHMDENLKNVTDEGYSQEAFEDVLSIREGTDHTKLLEMLADVNDETRDFQEIFDTYFNEENYLTWLAFNLLTGNDDIINHNFILYSPNNSKTWYFFAWDFDGALHYGDYESSLMKLPDSLKGGQKLNQNVLYRRYLQLPGSIEKIEKKMQTLLDDYITEEKVNSLLAAYTPVLEETMPLYPDIELLEMPPNELDSYMYGVYDYMESNLEMFRYASQFPRPMFLDKPKQNANNTVHFSWEPSYSYQGNTITYNLTVADDYDMNHILLEEKGLAVPEYDSAISFEPGTYYLKVTAVDSKGNEQLNMERYETMLTDLKGLNVNGVLQFTVD